MSENDKDDSEADATFDEKPVKKGGAATSIAWLAMFIALISVAAAGFLLLDKYRNASSAAESGAALAGVQRDLSASRNSIETLRGNVGELANDDSRTNSAVCLRLSAILAAGPRNTDIVDAIAQ